MKLRDPRNIKLNLMSNDSKIWNDESNKCCDDPGCYEKVHTHPKISKFFGDKNNNKVPDFIERPFKDPDRDGVPSFLHTQANLKKKLRRWI